MSTIIKQSDRRRAFVDTLNKLAETNDNIVVITCDVGFNYLDDPKNKFKVLNLGVTEQSAMVIAAALALSGMRVYFYSMINFSLFRPAEMVRNMVVCHNAPVTIIGVKGSSSYKFLGFSHNLIHDLEDIEFCRNIGLVVETPDSIEEVEEVLLFAHANPTPLYIRL